MRIADGAPPTVLVVDDDVDILSTLEALLALEGYRVITANDGARALALLRAGEHPSVIILDLMMPTMSGSEFRAEQLRDRELARIPVLVFTGDANAERKADSLGVVGMRKPVSLETLLSTIARLCGPARPMPAAVGV